MSYCGFATGHAATARWKKPQWVRPFKKTFKFTGGEITGEFPMSTGYLPGAQIPERPIYAKIEVLDPPWMRGA